MHGGHAARAFAAFVVPMMPKKNPVPPSSRLRAKASLRESERADFERAARLYEDFSGHQAGPLVRIKAKALPRVGIVIGHCDGLLYSTVRDGVKEKYIHKFRAKDRPLFVVSPDGDQLLLIGGEYDFTERGIVDKSDLRNR